MNSRFPEPAYSDLILGGEKFSLAGPCIRVVNYLESGMRVGIRRIDPADNKTKWHMGSPRISVDDIKRIVIHHDATLSAKHCYDIFQKRNTGSHFTIDNDGTIYQFADPSKVSAYGAGKFNQTSIHIDLSNAVYTNYQSWYIKEGWGERPIITQKIHDHNTTALGYYNSQLFSLEQLLVVLCFAYDIQPTMPTEAGVLSQQELDKFGVIGHYHLNRRKIDPFGLDWEELKSNLDELHGVYL